jgi:hypothetical protein
MTSSEQAQKDDPNKTITQLCEKLYTCGVLSLMASGLSYICAKWCLPPITYEMIWANTVPVLYQVSPALFALGIFCIVTGWIFSNSRIPDGENP